MKATEHYFPVVLFIMLYMLFLIFESSSVTIQKTAAKQYFPVVLFITMYKVVLTFEFVNEILPCDHSN